MVETGTGERILIVDDEPRLVRLVREVLKISGYHVISAADGETAVGMLATENPDLVLLDVLLGDGPDGYEVCRRMREFSAAPIIMLTARAREGDVLAGFDAGADDYLTKPFSAKELAARVKAVLRRARRPEELVTQSFKCGDLEIDFARRRVQVRGAAVALTRTEYELLRHLAVNAGKVMLHADVLAKVWGPEYRDDVEYLRAYVRHLRRKLEADPARPVLIVTAPGLGYVLQCPE